MVYSVLQTVVSKIPLTAWLKKCKIRPVLFHAAEMLEGEASPVGLILCAEKTREHVELLQLDQGDIRVAEYLTYQLPTTILEQKLHLAIYYLLETFFGFMERS